jgi:lysophospholipase L1-like esterase
VKRKGAFCAAAGLVLAVAGISVSAMPASASTGIYVALGDSYTSGPLITPYSTTAPVECLQSAANYPHLTAAALGLSLTDVSCAGATVSDLTTSQYPGVSPQFDALSASDSVVSLGIGGNDDETFLTAVAGCSALDVADILNIGAPCEAAFGNYFADNIASDGSNIAAALQQIHTLAPNATIYVVGYPDILPQSGNCYTHIPITTGDVAYLNGVEKDLNSMLQTEAAANGATFVDTYDPTIGHDLCKPESVRYIEPLIPSSDAISVHPNSKGEAAMASILESAING